MARFTDRLYELAEPIWEAQHSHPFVRGIGDGSLNVEKFKFWVRQDYLFLIDYSRVLAMAVVKAPDLPTMRRFAELVQATLNVEMELHQVYAAEFDISSQELEAETKAPTTQAYTDFLLRAGAGDYTELLAALLPCIWGFSEIGQGLSRGPRPVDERYGKWIDMYASAEFVELADWCRGLVDNVAKAQPAEVLRRIEEAFLISSRYELAFWEMAWTEEKWPV
jgi:thiaminase/transcriptional activator TenA